ncbi:MAG: hypothetical protein K2W96_11615 [Gemmataceae bacterium]|nr:hypothetical protein [Gemmataceae bacterium]
MSNPYDSIVYAAQPHHETIPDNLGALGMLLGLDRGPPLPQDRQRHRK